MKIVFRILAVILFIVFFGFALKNTQEVALRFFLDYELRGPLVLILLGFFVVGAVLGIIAVMPTLFRYRREAARQRKTAAALQKAQEAQLAERARPPLPDAVPADGEF
ncbi:MAG: LapA family protein [Burkholderiaceae bacterium]